MAETSEPDFSPFEDWLVDGPAGEWPEPWQIDKALTVKQQRVVVSNVELLQERDDWLKKVDDFEHALSGLPDKAQQITRKKYHIRFDRYEFADGPKDFSGYRFPCSVWFNGTNFRRGYVSFNNADFADGIVSFKRAGFDKGDVSFNNATFGEGYLYLNRAIFGDGDVWLYNSIFISTNVCASDVVVTGDLYVRANFPKAVDLRRLHVHGTANFSNCKFKHVPNFRDAKFDRPPEVADMQVSRPKLEGWTSRAVDEEDAAKFRKLKAMALAANDHEKDGEFFASEMLAKRGTETTDVFGLMFNSLYWWLSDFGQSIVLPILWGIASYFAFAGACFCQVGNVLPWADRLCFAASFSFRNLFPLFNSLFRFAPMPEKHDPWYQNTYDGLYNTHTATDIDRLLALGFVESVIGTVLLFLLLLALRNKFRLK